MQARADAFEVPGQERCADRGVEVRDHALQMEAWIEIQGQSNDDARFLEIRRIEVAQAKLIAYRAEIALGQIGFETRARWGKIGVVFSELHRIAAATAADADNGGITQASCGTPVRTALATSSMSARSVASAAPWTQLRRAPAPVSWRSR